MNAQFLYDLAGHKDSSSRAALVQQLSDLFLDGAAKPTESEQELFSDVLVTLIHQLESEEQVRTSNRLANASKTPRHLARQIAFCEVDIAMPMLERSQALSQEDLIEIAKTQSEAHLMGLSRRAHLCENVTDVIIDRGLVQPISSVARNLSANFSQDGFDKMLTQAQEGAREIARALSLRSDLPEEIAEELLNILPVSAQNRFKKMMEERPEELTVAVKETAQFVEESAHELQVLLTESQKLIEQIDKGARGVDDVLLELVRAKKVDSLCSVLSYLAELDARYVHNVFHKTEGTAFAVMCRALDLNPMVFGELFALRGHVLMKSYDIGKATDDYLLIERSLADETLQHLRLRDN